VTRGRGQVPALLPVVPLVANASARTAPTWEQRATDAEARIAAALAVHPKGTDEGQAHLPICRRCWVVWPCATVAALTGDTS
jgi:hypothetical protein